MKSQNALIAGEVRRSGAMNGSDSERMIAEIETFLRTGEAPPAAPEPPPRVVGVAQRRPAPPPGVPQPPLSPWRQVWSRVRPKPGRPDRGRPDRGRPDRGRPAQGPWPDRPRWTPARVVVILGALLALLLLPSLLSRRSSPASTGAVDHASTAAPGPGYTFLSMNRSGTPVRWNPCAPIEYRTDLAGAPSYAAQDLSAALRQVSAATGIRFVADGTTSVFPSGSGVSGTASRPGPVVIAWATPEETAALAPVPAGAAPNGLGRVVLDELLNQQSGQAVYVTGTVIIEAGADRLPAGFGPGGVGNVLLHEVGQLMGLGPVDDASQIMNPTVVPTKTGVYGSGDLAGLRRLGTASGCLSVPASGILQPVL